MSKKKHKLIDSPHCSSSIDGAITSKHLENRGTKKRPRLRPEAHLVDVQLIGPDTRDFTGKY